MCYKVGNTRPTKLLLLMNWSNMFTSLAIPFFVKDTWARVQMETPWPIYIQGHIMASLDLQGL